MDCMQLEVSLDEFECTSSRHNSIQGWNVKLRLILQDLEKATTLFGEQEEEKLQGVNHVICCTGTTAFPSRRWDGDNTPERVVSGIFLVFSNIRRWGRISFVTLALPYTIIRFVAPNPIALLNYITRPRNLRWFTFMLYSFSFCILDLDRTGRDKTYCPTFGAAWDRTEIHCPMFGAAWDRDRTGT
ncbi:hypothetical protein OSB04_013394, partial [Centaurea solstitialis]